MGGFASDNIELEVGINGRTHEGQAFSAPFTTREDNVGGVMGTESIRTILLTPEELADHQAWLVSRCQDDESETDDLPNASPPLVNNDSVDNDEEYNSMKSSDTIQKSMKKNVSVSTIHTKLSEMAPKYWSVDDTAVHTRFTISGADDQQLTVVKESEPIRGPKYYIMVDAQRGATKIIHSAYPAMDGWEGTELEERGFEMIIGSTTTITKNGSETLETPDLTTLLSKVEKEISDDDSQATIRIKTTRYASGSKSNLLNDVLVEENRDDDDNEELLEEEEEVRGGVEMILNEKNESVSVKSKKNVSFSNNKSKRVDYLTDFSTADFTCADITGCYDSVDEEEEEEEEEDVSHDEVTFDHDEVTLDNNVYQLESLPPPAVEELEDEIAKLQEVRKNLLRSPRTKQSFLTKIKNYAADAADVIKSVVPTTNKNDQRAAFFDHDTVLSPAVDDQTYLTDDDGSRTWHTNDDHTRSIKTIFDNAIDTIAATVGRWTSTVCGMADIITMTSCSATADVTADLIELGVPQFPKCAGNDTLLTVDLKSANNQDRLTCTGLKVGGIANVVTMTTCTAAADVTSNLMDGIPLQMPKCAGAIDDTLSSIDSKSENNHEDDRTNVATPEEQQPKVVNFSTELLPNFELVATPKWSDATVFNIGATGWVGIVDQFNTAIRDGVAQLFGTTLVCGGGSSSTNMNHHQEVCGDVKSIDDQTMYTAVTATGLNPYSDKVKMKKIGDIEVISVILPSQNVKALVADTTVQQQGKQQKKIRLTNGLRRAWQMSSGRHRNQRLVEI